MLTLLKVTAFKQTLKAVGINALFRVREVLLPRLLRVAGFKRTVEIVELPKNRRKRRRVEITDVIFKRFKRQSRLKAFRSVRAKFMVATPFIIIMVVSGVMYALCIISHQNGIREGILSVVSVNPKVSWQYRWAVWLAILFFQSGAINWK